MELHGRFGGFLGGGRLVVEEFVPAVARVKGREGRPTRAPHALYRANVAASSGGSGTAGAAAFLFSGSNAARASASGQMRRNSPARSSLSTKGPSFFLNQESHTAQSSFFFDELQDNPIAIANDLNSGTVRPGTSSFPSGPPVSTRVRALAYWSRVKSAAVFFFG